MTSSEGLAPHLQAAVPATPPKRPVTLTAAVWGGILTALLYLIGGIVMITAGKDSIREYVGVTVGADLGEAVEGVADAAIDEAYSTLLVKAGVAIGFALLVLVFAVLARGGATPARVGLAVALGLSLCAGTGLQLAESDVLPGFSVVASAFAPFIALVTIVLLFLPPTNRYAAARRRGR